MPGGGRGGGDGGEVLHNNNNDDADVIPIGRHDFVALGLKILTLTKWWNAAKNCVEKKVNCKSVYLFVFKADF